MRMTSSAASRWKFAAVFLCSILCHVAAQQDNSFLGELERQQRIQLEQQEIQGQLQDLALRHQAAKDSRNEERVILLEGAREKLLNKLQELQEELQRMLHGPRLPIRSQNVRRPAAPKTTTTTSTTPQTTTPTVRNQVDFQPQEEVFQIPEFPIQVKDPIQLEEVEQKKEKADQVQTKEPIVEADKNFDKTNETDDQNLVAVSSTSPPTAVPKLRIRVLKDKTRQRQRQRKQLLSPQFLDPGSFLGVLPPRQRFLQTPNTFGFATFDGRIVPLDQSFQSFSPVQETPQSFQQVFHTFSQPDRFLGQDQQSNSRAAITFVRVPQTFNHATQSFGSQPTSQAPVPEDLGKPPFPQSSGSFGIVPQGFNSTLQAQERPSQELGPTSQPSRPKPQSFRRRPQAPTFSGQRQTFSQDFSSSGQTPKTFAQSSQSFGQSSQSFQQGTKPSRQGGQGQQSFSQGIGSFSQSSFHSFGQSSQSSGQVPSFLQETVQFFEPFPTVGSFEVEQQPVEIQVAAPPPSCNTVDGVPGDCRPLVQCLTFYLEINTLSRSRCPLGVGSDGSQRLGVCCPLRGPLEVQFEQPLDRRNQGVLLPPPPPRVVIPQFTQQQLSSAANDALRKLQERVQATAFIFSQGVFVPPVQTAPSPVGTHQERFFALTPGGNTVKKAEDGQKNVEASISLVEQFNLTPDQGTFALPTFSLLSTIIGDACPRRPQCPGLDSELRFTKYRSADGTCNNLRNGEWGSANIALQRILPPKYGDGVNAPRVADGFSVSEANRDGGSDGLPGARVVSTQFAAASSPNAHSSHEHTLILMQWGQFLDHDLTHTPISRGNSGGISCCRNGMAIPFSSNLRHPDCYPIPIPGDDGFFKQFREKCMEFVRSLPAPRPQCNFGPREQMNQVTGYIDASNVYGSSSSSQRNLRALSGGRLKVQPSNPSQEVKQQSRRDKGLLPGSRDQCTDEFDEKECFDAGDVRANEQPELALMHTLWVREHNRIADALSEMHTNWSDEQLFQESRRIVAAEMQHITYNEFLPIILGKEYMDKFQLTPLVTSGGNHTHLYDADLNAGITNVFATAAFRFGHSLIQGNIQSFTKFGTVKQSLQLSKNQFSPFTLYEEGAVDDFVRGLSTQTCQRFDRFFTPELTNHLFQGDLPFGLDLVALNIQRGRDHGIAPYAEWREVCGYKKPTRWEDLLEVMERETVEVLRGVYNTVSEIDLFIGGVGERGGLGGSSSLLGPTFACLVGDQFARLRRGDRFYYEEGDQPSSFNDRQLEQLRKASLARILCDNSDDVAVMQPLAFYKATFLNQRVPCESSAIPRVDLRAWAQEIPAAA